MLVQWMLGSNINVQYYVSIREQVPSFIYNRMKSVLVWVRNNYNNVLWAYLGTLSSNDNNCKSTMGGARTSGTMRYFAYMDGLLSVSFSIRNAIRLLLAATSSILCAQSLFLKFHQNQSMRLAATVYWSHSVYSSMIKNIVKVC